MDNYLAMQNLNRRTMKYISTNITIGMSLLDIRKLCEQYMLDNGADSFWYYAVGAFVFSGDETTVSISGKHYDTSNRLVQKNDIVTIDLSPQKDNVWGDYSRTIIIEDGYVVDNVENIKNKEWKSGVFMEQFLHDKLIEIALPNMTFEDLYFIMNTIIKDEGFINLDFLGNLGHSIVKDKDKRVFIEEGNKIKLCEVEMFTFEPHISIEGSKFGYKMEDIYYFKNDKLTKL
ncbi:MAG: M24 family metallopeptidase [Coprobacillus sp.]